MKQFKDNEGRTWDVKITVATIKRVRDTRQINLLDVASNNAQQLFEKLNDPVVLGEVLGVVCEKELQQRNVAPDAFLDLFAGDVIANARDALFEEITDFFPQAPQRKALRAVHGQLKVLEQMGAELALKRLEALDVRLEALDVQAQAAKALPQDSATAPTS